MKTNPVYKRETMASSRSFRLALVLLVFNGILALVALLNMYSTLAQVRRTAEIQYSSFLDLYMFVAILEFIMVIFIMPALTAGSISGERERRTLELMLMTKMTPAQIVVGKLMASLSTMFLMIVSSLPILSIVFVYGGVTVQDMGLLFLCYASSALFVGSLGICCSAVLQKSTLATVVAYGLMGLIVVGTYAANLLALYVNNMRADTYLANMGRVFGTANSGNFLYLLLVNPTSTFIMTILRMAGKEQAGAAIVRLFGNHEVGMAAGSWVCGGLVIQILMAVGFLWLAVRALTPGKR